MALGDEPGEVFVHDGLHVALEHLQRERNPAPARAGRAVTLGGQSQKLSLQHVRHGVVVALPDEEHVGAFERGDDCLERDGVALRVVGAVVGGGRLRARARAELCREREEK